MIKYLQHHQIDKAKWNVAMAQCSNGLVYAYAWYLDIVSPGWDALIDSDYKVLMPLTRRKKFGFNYLCTPLFVQQLGIFSANDLTDSLINDFLRHIPDEFRLIELNLNTCNNLNSYGSFRLKQNITHHLRLNKTYDELKLNYSENVKRNLKRAKELNYEDSFSANYETVIKLFRQNKGKEVKTFDDDSYLLLAKLCKQAIKHNSLHVCSAYMDKQIVAGMLVMESNRHLIMLFSAVSEAGKKIGAMHWLIDHFIMKVSETHQGCLFDFEGSNNKNLARFYKSFGSEPVIYNHIKRNTLPKAISWLKK